MTWREWFNRPPWGNDPTPLDVVLDVGLVFFIAAVFLLC